MALTFSLQFPVISFPPPSKLPHRIQTRPILIGHQSETLTLNLSKRRRSRDVTIISAIEAGRQDNESETQISASPGGDDPESESRAGELSGEVTELGKEIKKAMEERKGKELETGGDFWSGVAQEVREIEWPAFGKVLGTTGVVLGVIAGSSVVLLTVNAVLAELSDRVFAGKGVQDFFG